jgi:hypothetical protein
MYAPEGHPPSYYAGQADGVPAYSYETWRQWVEARKPALEALQTKVQAAKESGHLPGCIGQIPADCIVTLAKELVIADTYTAPSFLDSVDVDVNGKQIVPHFLQIYAFRPGTLQPNSASRIPYLQDRHPLFLYLSSADKVTKIGVLDGQSSLLRAHSETDYDQTFIYEILHPLLSSACPDVSRLDVYRFIENKLKPPVRNAAAEGQTAKLRVNTKASPLLPFCGRKLKLEIVTERPKYHPDELFVRPQLIIQ